VTKESGDVILTFGDEIIEKIEREHGPRNVQSIDDVLGEPCPNCGTTMRLMYAPSCMFVEEDGFAYVNMQNDMVGTMDCSGCKKLFIVEFTLKLTDSEEWKGD
jgi:hypothetical protein